jgi:hypothetical protein
MATHGPINGVKVSRALLIRFDRFMSYINSITFYLLCPWSFARYLFSFLPLPSNRFQSNISALLF